MKSQQLLKLCSSDSADGTTAAAVVVVVVVGEPKLLAVEQAGLLPGEVIREREILPGGAGCHVSAS